MRAIPVKKNIIPDIISFIFHPLWYPLAGMCLILKLNINDVVLPEQYQFMMLKITFLCTIVFPLGLIPLILYLKAIKSIQLKTRSERFLPLTIICIAYYMEYFFIYKYAPAYIVMVFLFSVCVVILTVLIVNIFWKISLHTVGLGGCTALILAVSVIYHIDLFYLLIACIFVSGIVASARLAIKAHSFFEIWTGYLIGFFIVFITFLFY